MEKLVILIEGEDNQRGSRMVGRRERRVKRKKITNQIGNSLRSIAAIGSAFPRGQKLKNLATKGSGKQKSHSRTKGSQSE